MNYIKQLNTFFELLLINPLSPNAQCLYTNLLNINNKCNWKKEFTIANSTLMAFTGLNKQSLYRARNILVQKELIKFKKGINQTQSGIYEIIEFDTASDTADDTPSDTADDTAPDTATDTNNKLNKTKQKQIKKKDIKKETEEERNRIKEIYNSICTNLPKVQKLTDKRNKAIDSFVKEFSEEQFSNICEIANNSKFLIGENKTGWKADFDFLMRVDKATSVLEGKYNNLKKEKANGTDTTTTSKYANIDFSKNTSKYNGEAIDDTGLI